MKFITDPFQFFIMNDFNFSLFGAIFGFLLVLKLLVRIEKSTITRYIDGVTLSFLFILIIGYIGAFFGGQVYGRETMMAIDILYTNPYTPVPYQVPIFPLPIVYAISSFIIFFSMYILSLFIHIRGYIGYIGIMLFGASILIFESFSGKPDILSVVSIFNLPQIYASVLILWSGYNFSQIFSGKDSQGSITL